jgi:hypothetical protein
MGLSVITGSSSHMRDDDVFLQEHLENLANVAGTRTYE